MAFAEKHGSKFRLVFRLNGKRFTHTLMTELKSVADGIVGGVNRTLMLLEQRVLQLPDDADVLTFVLSGGQQTKRPETEAKPQEPITFHELRQKYIETLSVGAVEENSLDTIKMHLRHVCRTLGEKFSLQNLTLSRLQDHVNRRAKAKGHRGRKLSPATLRKEIASFRAAWNWGVQSGLLDRPYPNKGLKFPKSNEKPPFQTWKEIEKQLTPLSENERQDVWDCLFLTMPELDALLAYIREQSIQPFLYPMCCLAAYTGARRSEMLRLKLSDLDLEAGSVRISERKRVHGQRTSRRVPLASSLVAVLKDWLTIHPGGPFVFAQPPAVAFSKKKRLAPTAITRDEAHDHLKRAVADGKWKVIRGWHLFRHVEGGSKRRRWGRVGAVEFGGAHGFTSATWHNRGLRP